MNNHILARRIQSTIFILIAVMMLSASLASNSYGWGGNIHKALCQVVWNNLEKNERNNLVDIIQNHEIKYFSTGCAWPDWVKKKHNYTHTAAWHYQNLEHSDKSNIKNCTDGCLVSAILKNVKQAKISNSETRAENIYFAMHLIADLHQPLHLGHAHDKGGNRLDVVFKKKNINLHQLWDSKLLPKKTEDIILIIQKNHKFNFKMLQIENDIDHWLDESQKIATEQIYPAYTENMSIDQSYIEQYRPIIDQQLNNAAYRMFLVLKSILRNSDDSK